MFSYPTNQERVASVFRPVLLIGLHAVMEIRNIRTVNYNSNNQAAWSGWLWGNHNVQIMPLLRSEIFASYYNSIGIYTPRSRLRKEFTSDYHRKHHTQIFSTFLKRGYLSSTTPVLLIRKAFFPLLHFCQYQSGASNRLWRKIPTTHGIEWFLADQFNQLWWKLCNYKFVSVLNIKNLIFI